MPRSTRGRVAVEIGGSRGEGMGRMGGGTVTPPEEPQEPVLPYTIYGRLNVIGQGSGNQKIETEIQVSGTLKDGPISYVIGSTRVTGQIMRKPVVFNNRFMYIPYFLCRVPPGMEYDFSEFRVDRTPVFEGSGTGTGVPWVSSLNIKNGSMTQEVTTGFAGVFPDFNQRLRTFAYAEVVLDFNSLPDSSQIPVFSSIVTSPTVKDWYGNDRQLTNLPTALWWFLTMPIKKRAVSPQKLDSESFDVAANECDIDVNGEELWNGNGQLIGKTGEEITTTLTSHFWGSLSWNWGETIKLVMLKRDIPVTENLVRSDFDPRERFKARRVQDDDIATFVEVGFTETENYTIDTVQYRDELSIPNDLTDPQAQMDLFTSSTMARRWGSVLVERSKLTQLFGEGVLHSSKAVTLDMFSRVSFTNDLLWNGAIEWLVDQIQPRAKSGDSHIVLSEYDENALAIAYGLTPLPDDGSGLEEIINPVNPGDPEALSIIHEYTMSEDLTEPIAGNDAAAWDLLNVVATPNTDIAPNGLLEADRLTNTTGTTGRGYDPNLWPVRQVGFESNVQQSVCWIKRANIEDIIMLDVTAPIFAYGQLVRLRWFWRLIPIVGYSSWGGSGKPDRGGPAIQLSGLADEAIVWGAGYRPNNANQFSHEIKISWDPPAAPWLITGVRVQYRMADQFVEPSGVIYGWTNWGPLVPVENGFLTIGSSRNQMMPWFPDSDPSLSLRARLYDWRVISEGINESKIETEDPSSVTINPYTSIDSAMIKSTDLDPATIVGNGVYTTDPEATASRIKPMSDFYLKWERLLLTYTGVPFIPGSTTLIMAQNTGTPETGSVISIIAGDLANSVLALGRVGSEYRCRFRYEHATDSLHIYVNGVEYITVSSIGMVGINNNAPTSELDVIGETATSDLIVSDTARFSGNIIIDEKPITIDAGWIDVTGGSHFRISNEGGVSIDDIIGITGGAANKVIHLRKAELNQSFVLRSKESTPNSINVWLADLSMYVTWWTDSITLRYSVARTQWEEMGRSTLDAYQDLSLDLLDDFLVNPTSRPSQKIFANNGAGSTGVYSWEYEDGRAQHLGYRKRLQAGYRGGTDLYPGVNFCPTTSMPAGPYTVHWQLEYTIARPGTVYPDTIVVDKIVNLNDPVVAREHYYEHITPQISGVGQNEGSVIYGTITRRGDLDTYPNGVSLAQHTVHFRKASRGNWEI